MGLIEYPSCMGLFKKNSPAQDLFSLSNHKIMPGFLQHPNGRFIWFPSTGNAGPDAELFQISLSAATPLFKEFAHSLIAAVNSNPSGGDVVLEKFPVTSLATSFKIQGSEESTFHPGKVAKKVSIFVFIDSQNVGKLFFPMRNEAGQVLYEVGFDLGFDLASDYGFKLWMMTQTNINDKTGLFLSMEFALGETEPDLLLLSLARNPSEYMNYLNQAGLKG